MSSQIDTVVYDRQIRLWGVTAQKRLMSGRVLVIGVGGVAAEFCKNVVLAGIGQVVLWDDNLVHQNDLASQFFLQEEDIGRKTRAGATQEKLQALNPLVKVDIMSGISTETISEKDVAAFDLVFASQCSRRLQLKLSELCHCAQVKFLHAHCHGLFAECFIDFGLQQWTKDVKQTDGSTQHVEGNRMFPSMTTATKASWNALKRPPNVFFALELLEAVLGEGKVALEAVNTQILQACAEELTQTHGVKMMHHVPLSLMIVNQWEVEMNAVCAIIGGVLAQEAIKGISGKEEPLCNFFIFDGMDSSGCVITLGC